jgi:hypothetical protein
VVKLRVADVLFGRYGDRESREGFGHVLWSDGRA